MLKTHINKFIPNEPDRKLILIRKVNLDLLHNIFRIDSHDFDFISSIPYK